MRQIHGIGKKRDENVFFVLNQIDLHRHHHHDGLEEPLGTSVEKKVKNLALSPKRCGLPFLHIKQTNKKEPERYQKTETERDCTKFALSNYFCSR